MKISCKERLPAFDNLRAFLVLLGFAIHSVFCLALSHQLYRTSGPASVEQLTQALSSAERFFLIGIYYICVFMMPAFFLLAGFFGCLSYQQRGEVKFISNRLHRIGLPFLFCMLWSLSFYFVFFAFAHFFPNFTSEAIQSLVVKIYIINGGWWGIINQLRETWFLYDLLWLYALTIFILKLKQYLQLSAFFFKKTDACLLVLFKSRWLYVGVALLCSLLLSQQDNLGWRTSEFTLLPSFGFLAYYGVWYGLGWWLWGHQDKFSIFFIQSGFKPLFSIVLYGVFMVWYFYCLNNENFFNRNFGVFIYELSAALMVLALFGGAWRSVHKSNKVLRYISSASYWLYLVQLPIILVLLGFNYSSQDNFFMTSIKLMIGSLVLALLSYQILVRHTWLNSIFGDKARP